MPRTVPVCANTVAHAAGTGDASCIKALKVFARVILHKVKGDKKRVTKVVLGRLTRWEKGEFDGLLHDLFVYDDWQRSLASAKTSTTFADSRSRRVTEKIRVGELSKALQTQMSSDPYSGDMSKLDDLHPPKQEPRLREDLHHLRGLAESPSY